MGISNPNAGGGLPYDRPASHPGKRRNIPSLFMLLNLELSASLMGHLACKQTLS